MSRLHHLILISLLSTALADASSGTGEWPGGAMVAVSLSYDDALVSQLDAAIPALNQYSLKGSFYLPAAYPGMQRVEDWRRVAEQGHELGNHTLFHSCHPDNYWVEEEQDLERYSMKQIVREVRTANTFLQALDGLDIRTFTPPCFDLTIGGESYIPLVEGEFVAIKGLDNGMPEDSHVLLAPDGADGASLIQFVRDNTTDGKLINIVFHGVGGDYLSVSVEAHEALLRFLAEHRDTYWVDTYRNIMLWQKRRSQDRPDKDR